MLYLTGSKKFILMVQYVLLRLAFLLIQCQSLASQISGEGHEGTCRNVGKCPSFNNANANEHINKWSAPSRCEGDRSSRPEGRYAQSAAAYTRGPDGNAHADNDARMVMFGGAGICNDFFEDTWLYYPSINSWINPQMKDHPSGRVLSTMTTMCRTKVFLFGGLSLEGSLNDTWVFHGVTETWSQLEVSAQSGSVTSRFWHSAAPVHQPISNCTCKKSLLVYEGTTKYSFPYIISDPQRIWELRCMDDSTPRMRYEWIPHDVKGSGPTPRLKPNSISFGDSTVYLWEGIEPDTRNRSFEVWRYDLLSNVWTLITNRTYFRNNTGQIVAGKFSPYEMELPYQYNNESVGLALPAHRGTLYLLNLTTGEQTLSLNEAPTPATIQNMIWPSVAAVGDVILLYGGFDLTVGFSDRLWSLNASDGWRWTSVWHPDKTPMFILQSNGALVGDSIYLFGGLLRGALKTELVPNHMWQLNLVSNSWSRSWSVHSPTPRMLVAVGVVNASVIVLFGGTTSASLHYFSDLTRVTTATNETWLYFAETRRWTMYVTPAAPSARAASILVTTRNGSLLLFGGFQPGNGTGEALNDLWMLNICSHEFVSTVEDCGGWHRLGPDNSSETWPDPGNNHTTAASIEDLMMIIRIVAGEGDWALEVWQYNITARLWRRHVPNGSPPPLPSYSVRLFAAAFHKKIIVLVQDASIDFMTTAVNRETFVYSVDQEAWITQSTESPNLNVDLMMTYKEQVIVLGLLHLNSTPIVGMNELRISVMMPRCAAGFASSDWSRKDCKPCPAGKFSPLGSRQCQTCPTGRKTTAQNSTSLADCQCDENYCLHGSCYVVSVEAEAQCRCGFGYSGSRCQTDHVRYIILGICLSFIVIVIVIGSLIRKCIGYRHDKSAAEEELDTLKKVWSVGLDEITVLSDIGTGGSGVVSKASYRDMVVVVKKLQADLTEVGEYKDEFRKEIEFMQAIRHPNIVLFFGAGMGADGIPFLVLEFVPRGSLRAVLDDETIEIKDDRRVSFALDTAKGMRFLHSSSPPRVHRDLKSLNLLVSSNWTVKVADFGTARTLKTKWRIRNILTQFRLRRRNAANGDLIELQEINIDTTVSKLTGNTGTLLWQAPETIGPNTHYGKSADVYR